MKAMRANILRAQKIIAAFRRDNKGKAMEVQMQMVERFDPEEVAAEASWRPKWTPSGPVVLIEPDEGSDMQGR